MATNIPIIDFGPFLTSTDQKIKLLKAKELFDAAHHVGFMMLTNYDTIIPQADVEKAFELAKQFFALPLETKEKLAWESAEANRGWVQQGREVVSQSSEAEAIADLRANAPDVKESMEIGKDYGARFENKWPSEEVLPGFRTFMNNFFEACCDLQVEVMRALALSLGLDEHCFDDKINEKAHNLRLLDYPPIRRGNSGKRSGAHSDYGSITLLFQDMVGGLEVQSKTGEFVPVKPKANTVVVNVADLLQRWSNDVFKSTVHRVVLPPKIWPDGEKHAAADEEFVPRRNSIVHFGIPNPTQLIECLPGLGEAKYEPILSGQYLVQRLSETYA